MVSKEFEEKTGKKRVALSQAVKRLCNTRKKEIENLETGEEDENNSWTQTIDEWISIHEARLAKAAERKEAQGIADEESASSLRWRQAQLGAISNKKELRRLALSNEKERRESSDSPHPLCESPPSSSSPSPSSSSSQSKPQKARKRRRKISDYSSEEEESNSLSKLVEIIAAREMREERKERQETEAALLAPRIEKLEKGVNTILEIMERKEREEERERARNNT